MMKDKKKQRVCVKIKNNLNQKNKFSTNSTRGNIFSHAEPEELKSPSKKTKLLGKRNNKTNSCSSSNQNKTEIITTRLKEKKEKKEISKNKEYNIENKKLNNYLHRTKYISKSKHSLSKNTNNNNLNISKNNSKKLINYHYSFFINESSNKYKRNLASFNNSDSFNNSNLNNKTINYTLNKFMKKKNNLSKNITKKNSINSINNLIKKNKANKYKNNIKNQSFKKYYSNNTISSPYNMHDPYYFYRQPNTNMNSNVTNTKNSSLSNTTSKEKNNFNKNTKYVEVNLKDDKMLKNHIKTVQRQKFILDDMNSGNMNNKIKINVNRKKKLNNPKFNSRNINNRSHNYSSNNFQYINNNNNNKSTIVNIKHIDNKIMNYIQMNNNKTYNEDISYNKIKNISQKKTNNEKYNTVTHSPTNALNKKIFFNFLNISKMIYENNKIKEKNNNLSSQINDMTKEFENMKKENIIIKKELQEKSKMIKDMKLTIDIFNQELNKLQRLSNNKGFDNLIQKDMINNNFNQK